MDPRDILLAELNQAREQRLDTVHGSRDYTTLTERIDVLLEKLTEMSR